MIVGTLEIHLRIEGSYSLKDKRRVLRSLIERARSGLHVSIAEVADHDLWNVATIGAACVGNDARTVESVLAKVTEIFERSPEASVESALTDISHR